jgi:hypothetical protein
MQILNKTIQMFSVFSGTFYEVLRNDIKFLDVGQLPLKKKINSRCSKCFGRGHLGRDTQTHGYIVCNCLRKSVDHDMIKHVENPALS